MTEINAALSELYNELSLYASTCTNGNTFISEEDFILLMIGRSDQEKMRSFSERLRTLATIHKTKYGLANPMLPSAISRWTGQSIMDTVTGVGVPILDDIMSELQSAALKEGTKMASETATRISRKIKDSVEALGRVNSRSGQSDVRADGFGENGAEDISAITSMPLRVSYNSGVETTTYKAKENVPTRSFRTSENGDGRIRSADLACVVQRFPPANDYSLAYWQNTLIPNMQLKAQASVGFNINASYNFAYTRVVGVFNLYADALAKYFFMVNTYSVIQGPGQNDVSRNVLRRMFQTSDLQYLAILRERLNALPIPPKLIERSAFLYSTYKTNPNDDVSNNIGFVPVPLTSSNDNEFFDTIDMDLLSTIRNLGELLDNPNHNYKATVDMMARVFPDWVKTQVGATQEVPEYSHEFNNIFLNSPGRQTSFLNANQNTFNFPSSTEDTELKQFVISGEFVREKIGDQQAASGIYRSADLEWSGTLVPEASSFNLYGSTAYTNRYSFVYDTSNGVVWTTSNNNNNNINGFGVLAMSQPYANFVCGSDVYHVPPFGTYSVMGNSVNSMSQPTIEWMAEMFDLGSLTSRSDSRKSYGGKKSNSKKDKDKEDA